MFVRVTAIASDGIVYLVFHYSTKVCWVNRQLTENSGKKYIKIQFLVILAFQSKSFHFAIVHTANCTQPTHANELRMMKIEKEKRKNMRKKNVRGCVKITT